MVSMANSDESKINRGDGGRFDNKKTNESGTEALDEPQHIDLQGVDFSQAPLHTKTAMIQATVADGGERITTVLAGGHEETTKTAHPGDAIVTNPGGERYIIDAQKFADRYHPTEVEGQYQATGQAYIMPNPSDGPITITAPWGEPMHGAAD